MKTALTVAGSDCSGGAGIQADLKTMTMNGVFGMSAITALTAQNTTGVSDVFAVSPAFLAEQIDMVFKDIRPDAVKIGMVASADLIAAIAERLTFWRAENVVVDPVMVATSGARLIEEDAVEALTRELFPLACIVTPNIPEAELLCELAGTPVRIADEAAMEAAARTIGERFGCAVLVKGGHRVNDANDVLFEPAGNAGDATSAVSAADGDGGAGWGGGTLTWFAGERIDNPNTHGTGCTLSSAIASNLAKGYPLVGAVRRAKAYLSGALAAQLDLGAGAGPMAHNFDYHSEFAN